MGLQERLPGFDSELSKKTIKDQISDKLAYMICSGLLQVGDELPSERELASMLDVSRVTVRGAVQTLAALRMISVTHGARTRVVRADGYAMPEAASSLHKLKTYSADTINEARKELELAVVGVAVKRISAKELTRMERLLTAQATMLDDPVQFQISDREFHAVIYGATHNPLLETYAQDLYAHSLGSRRAVLKKAGSARQGYEDHVDLLDALVMRDPERAAVAIALHLDHAHDAYQLAVGQQA